jgi:uncharacterized protein YjbJ (UPF0337 family)
VATHRNPNDARYAWLSRKKRKRAPVGANQNGTCTLLDQATDRRDNRTGANMNWDRMEGNWKQFKGKVKEQWGKLTDDDLDEIAGRRDQLEGKIQQRYGMAKDQVSRDLDDWANRQNW